MLLDLTNNDPRPEMGVLPVSLQRAPQGDVPRWDITLRLSRELQAEVPCMGNQPV